MNKRSTTVFILSILLIFCFANAQEWSGKYGYVQQQDFGPYINRTAAAAASAQYIVKQNLARDSAFVFNGISGTIDTSGVNQTAVIQYALNNVDSGKVVISGIYTEMDSLVVHSNTVIELVGSITIKDSLASYVFGTDSAEAVQNIEIYGGTIDAHGIAAATPYQTEWGTSGMYLWNVTNACVHDMTIYGGDARSALGENPLNKTGMGIYISRSNWVTVDNCVFDSARYNQILAQTSHYLTITNNHINCVNESDRNVALQIGGCTHSTITNNTILFEFGGIRTMHSDNGYNLFDGNILYCPDSTRGAAFQLNRTAYYNTITNNKIDHCLTGIWFTVMSSTITPRHNLISNNHFSRVYTVADMDSASADSNVFLNNVVSKFLTGRGKFMFDVGSRCTGNKILNTIYLSSINSDSIIRNLGTYTTAKNYDGTSLLDTVQYTVNIPYTQISDNYLREYNQPYYNYGSAGSKLLSGYISTYLNYLMIYFPVDTVPYGAFEISATCSLYMDANDSTVDVFVKRVTKDWYEGAADGAYDADGASWGSRGYGTEGGSVTGGTIAAADTAWGTYVNATNYDTASMPVATNWGTLDLSSLVNFWVNTQPDSNFGLRVGKRHAGGVVRTLPADWATTSYRTKVWITYKVVE